MNTEMTPIPHISSTALIRRMRFHHGVPFVTSAALAVVTIAWLQTKGVMWGWGSWRSSQLRSHCLAAAVCALFSLRSRLRLRSFSLSAGYFICVLLCRTFRSAGSKEKSVRVSAGSPRFRFLSSGSLRHCLIAMNETPNRSKWHYKGARPRNCRPDVPLK